MTVDVPPHRARYVAAVRALRVEADRLLASGWDEEAIARRLVAWRNALKVEYRAFDSDSRRAELERRNRGRYQHPVGGSPEWFYAKYGSWAKVIDAACRPAELSDGA